jgi:hypothetical protein
MNGAMSESWPYPSGLRGADFNFEGFRSTKKPCRSAITNIRRCYCSPRPSDQSEGCYTSSLCTYWKRMGMLELLFLRHLELFC